MLSIFKRRFSTWDTSDGPTCRCRKRFKILFIFYFFTLTVLPLVSLILIKYNDFNGSTIGIIARAFFIFAYLESIVTICIIATISHKRNDKHTSISNRKASLVLPSYEYINRLKQEQANVLIAAFVTVLGVADSVFNVTELVNYLIKIINQTYKSSIDYSYIVVSCFECAFRTIFYIFLLVFVVYQKEFKHVLSCISLKCFVSNLSVFCFYQWIFVIFDEIKNGGSGDIQNLCDTDNMTTINSTKLYPINNIQQFLYPLSIEFRITLFVELLFFVLNAKKTSCLLEDSNVKFLLKKIRNAIFCILNTSCECVNRFFKMMFCFKIPFTEQSQIIKKHTVGEYFFIFGLIMISILMVTISFVVILFQTSNIKKNTSLVNLSYEICGLVITVILLIYALFLFIIIRKRSKLDLDHPVGFNDNIEQKIDFFFLVAAYICNSLFLILSFGGLIKSFAENKKESSRDSFSKIFQLIITFLKLIESPSQLFIIWIIQCKILLLSGYIQILALLNFSLWIFNTFTITLMINDNNLQSVYGDKEWEYMVTTLGPIYLFYRFHTCILLIKIKNKKYSRS